MFYLVLQLHLFLFLSKSDFGIWFLHKGVLCFDGVREVDEILLQFGRLDSVVSEAIGRGDLGTGFYWMSEMGVV
ncbi:hypothetical protein V527_06165 [Pseudomonas aeruginosa VRFPA06]|nr:hypothetical protein V527_06165 [Pseudomonas aeruginosa VRFPA06]